MMSSGSSSCCSCRAVDVVTKSIDKKMDFALLTIKSPMRVVPCGTSITSTRRSVCGAGVRASAVDSYESSSNFVKRMEQAWLISQDRCCFILKIKYKCNSYKHAENLIEQPRPVSCSTCNSNGHINCKWCAGTGFFILGDNMLCQVPSRNTTCVICAGKGSVCCSDCKGTGFRAKWLGEPPISK